MMEVFGAGDPKPLIGGISEALITTELGLILAIPALLLHALLSRRARSLLAKMERASVALCNGLMTHQVKLSQTQQP
jgi:biopolymer transport protein ExbB